MGDYATDLVAYHARVRPGAIAIESLETGERVTWAAFEDRVARLASVLASDFGVRRGDRVAVLAENDPMMLYLQFACFRIGALYVPYSWRLAPPELEFCCKDIEPALLVHDEAYAELAHSLGEATNIAYLGNAQSGIGMGVVENAATAPDDVAVGGGSPFYLSWSPDGQRLFVHVGTDQLGFTDLKHGLRELHDRPGTFQAPVWLPDGRTVYDRLDGTQQRLVVVDGDHRRALADVTGSVAFVASPDGRRIAYRVDGGTASQDGVFVRPIDGGRPTLVTHTGAELLATDPYRPSQTFGQRYLPFFDQYAQAFTPWAPDGSAFAFAGEIDGRSGIYVQRVDGGAPTFVSDGEFVLWSPPERATSTN